MNIQINQIGYKPNDYKTATFRIGDTLSVSDSVNSENKLEDSFRVVNTESGETVYEGKLSDVVSADANGEVNKIADFSAVNKPGRYAIEGDISGKSYEFEIKEDIYDDVFKATVKMFYLHRCGVELPKETAGKYAHKACHNTPARIYGTDTFIDVSGAWHDAGDYGRYIVAGAKAVVDLMMAYEFYPEVMSRNYIGVNEAGAPEILDEIKFELDWMLKMQDTESGAVYHKVTCAGFPGFVMPEEETEELIVSPVSDTATADFAAAMAYAYRFYSKLAKDAMEGECKSYCVISENKAKEYADAAKVYMAAANKAMDFLEEESAGEFINPEGIVTGEYGDERTIDEYFWAYAEMFKTTGDYKYEALLKSLNLDEVPGEFGWKEVGDYGFYAYITAPWEKDEEFYKACYKRFTDEVEVKTANFKADPYGASIYGYYYWGCNMEIADNARRGIIIDKLEGTDKYKNMAMAQLSYLFGNNPNSKCYVTGFGSDSPKNPHHRPSAAVGEAMPGMLVGGPEPLMLDDVAKELFKDRPIAKCYVDHLESYSTNEITIYWNSPLVFLLAWAISEDK